MVNPKKEEGKASETAGASGDGETKKLAKGPVRFTYDYTRCCLCGYCVENCPVHSLRFSDRAYLAGRNRNAFIFDLLEPFGT